MRFAIRLRLGIAVAFLLVMVPMTIGIVGYFYWTNSVLMLQTAQEAMDRTTRSVVSDVQNLITPVSRIVAATTVLAQVDRGSLHKPNGLRFFYEQIQELPQL